MQFTVVKLFNHKSFGLDAPHLAVVADMDGVRRVIDMFTETEAKSAERLCAAFTEAKSKMPHRAHPHGGGEIDFYTSDSQGRRVKQSTAHIPATSQTGETFEESLLNWLSWRARVGLWLQGGQRPALTHQSEARILETVLPPLVPLEACNVRQTRHDYMADKASAPLTPKPASL